ncbi:MAG: DUF5312 family protein [Spirochaetales bacterium]|jgi:hypothetical protein|nr:DUF5312 family protein [Spirochaetales bacterium]
MANSGALSEDEQRRLRERIKKALCLDMTEETVIIQAPSDIQNHVGKLRDDLKQSSAGSKLNSLVRNAFSIKTDAEKLLDARLRKLKETIQSGKTVYCNFTNRTLSPELGAALYQIYRFVEILRSSIILLFSDPSGLEMVIRRFLERQIGGAKAALTDFITAGEMKELLFKNESSIELAAEINRRLQEYCRSFSDLQLDQYAAGIVPLYYFKRLLAFPFHDFFSEFQYQRDETAEEADPVFHNAQLRPALDMLETLYCLLHPLKKLDPDAPVYPEILEMAVRYTAGKLIDQVEENSGLSESARHLLKNIKNLVTITQRTLANVPLVELIRYYKNDPYYKLMVYPPRLKLAEFYTDSLRMKVFDEFEVYFPNLQNTIFDDLVQELFKGEPEDFDYFMNTGLGTTPRKGYSGFSFPRSLKILNTFIKTHYYNYIQGLIHSLNKVMSHRVRTSFSQLLVYAGGIESVGTKLKNFDLSFSPDAEDGKMLVRLKFIVDKELSQQKAYIALIRKKNEEAKSLLDNGLNYASGIYNSLSAIEKDSAFVSDAAAHIQGIQKTLKRSVRSLFIVTKLIRYVMTTETGSFSDRPAAGRDPFRS